MPSLNIPRKLKWNDSLACYLEPYRSFTACGDCWQKIGIHATFDVNIAIDWAKLLLKYNKEVKFRIIHREFLQKTKVFATFN